MHGGCSCKAHLRDELADNGGGGRVVQPEVVHRPDQPQEALHHLPDGSGDTDRVGVGLGCGCGWVVKGPLKGWPDLILALQLQWGSQ